MVFSERGPLMALGEMTGLSWFILESRKAGESIPVGAALRIAIAACERLTVAQDRTDARGRPRKAPHGSLAPTSIGLRADGVVRVYRELVSSAVAGRYPRSPEQLAGGAPSARGDVFSLAVILYELLTGRVIFASGDAPPEEEHEVVSFPLPPDPPSRSLRVPPAVDRVLLRAMAEEPAARYADAAELGAALTALAAELGVPATQAEVALWHAAVFTPQRQRAREAEFESAMLKMGDLVAEIEKLQAEADGKTLAAVPPPPSDAELEAFERNFRIFERNREASRRRFEVASSFDDPAPLPPPLRSKQALALFTSLTEHGFERLGVKVETEVFSGTLVPAVAFASPAARAFATVFVQHPGDLGLFLSTPCAGGEVVLTADYPRPDERSPRAMLSGRPGAALEALLAAHAAQLAELTSQGPQPLEAFDRQALLEATDDWYQCGLERHDESLGPLEADPGAVA